MPSATAPIDDVLAKLSDTRRSGDGWTARCPAHEDRHASLSVSAGDGSRVLLHCFAGCRPEQIVQALGLEMRDLFPTVSGERGAGVSIARKRFEPSNPTGCTLSAYAEVKRLSLEFLQGLGLREIAYMGAKAIRIPYRGVDGNEVAVRFRTALAKSQDGPDDRFRWRKGSRPALYGLDRLAAAQASESITLVEGESDCHTLWSHGVPAIGVPGAALWREDRDAGALDGIPTIYVVIEPDRGGETVCEWIAKSRIRDRVRLVRLGEFGDVSAVHVDSPERFSERWTRAIAAATRWTDIAAGEAARQAEAALLEADGLLDDPNLLERIRDMMARRGYAGDTQPPLTVYMTMTSRLLPRPANLALIAASAAGKNKAIDSAAELFPPEALHIEGAGSARALVYEDEDFAHRVVIVAEADSIPDEGPGASAIRSIAEENVLRYDVVERDEKTGRFTTRHIVKPGPTSLITTSTRSLALQLGTRMLEVAIPDSEQQTREVMRAHARRVNGSNASSPDAAPFVSLQRWLALAGERRVLVPFAETLIDLIPAWQVRMRRDSAQLLTFVQASALLHQRQRARAADGSVLATIADYAAARDLLLPIFDSVAADGVTLAVRETVEAVQPGEELTEADLARRLSMAKSSVSYRVGRALRGGWLTNREQRKGHPKRLVLGTPLPEATLALPDPDAVREGFEGPNESSEEYTPPPLDDCEYCGASVYAYSPGGRALCEGHDVTEAKVAVKGPLVAGALRLGAQLLQEVAS